MPVYEYQCKACGRDFEYQQRMSDPDKTVCEACGGALDRLISRTAFSLKGGGWYKDLYASSKPEAKSSETKSSEGGGPAAPSSGGESSAPKSDSGTSASPSPSPSPSASPSPSSSTPASSGTGSSGGSSGSGTT